MTAIKVFLETFFQFSQLSFETIHALSETIFINLSATTLALYSTVLIYQELFL